MAAKIVEVAVADPLSLTEAELAGIAARTLVMAGDDDIVHLEHTLALYRAVHGSELVVVPVRWDSTCPVRRAGRCGQSRTAPQGPPLGLVAPTRVEGLESPQFLRTQGSTPDGWGGLGSYAPLGSREPGAAYGQPVRSSRRAVLKTQ